MKVTAIVVVRPDSQEALALSELGKSIDRETHLLGWDSVSRVDKVAIVGNHETVYLRPATPTTHSDPLLTRVIAAASLRLSEGSAVRVVEVSPERFKSFMWKKPSRLERAQAVKINAMLMAPENGINTVGIVTKSIAYPQIPAALRPILRNATDLIIDGKAPWVEVLPKQIPVARVSELLGVTNGFVRTLTTSRLVPTEFVGGTETISQKALLSLQKIVEGRDKLQIRDSFHSVEG